MSPRVLQYNTKLNYFETYSVNRDQMVCTRGRTLKLHPFIGKKKKHGGDSTTSICPKSRTLYVTINISVHTHKQARDRYNEHLSRLAYNIFGFLRIMIIFVVTKT